MPDESFVINLPIELDDDGYLDRQCPWSECGRAFKVMNDDWEAKVSVGCAYCPFCGHESEPSDFSTPEREEYFREAALAFMNQQLVRMLGDVARDFNRSMPKRGPISMRMDVSSPSVSVPLQPAAQDTMTMRVACERCECRFAVIGAGFFCPTCRYNSAGHTLEQAVAAARRALSVLPTVMDSISDADARDQVARHLIEAQIGNLVTAFQRFAEVELPRLPASEKPPRRNAFQNITEGDRLWSAAGGTSYSAILDAAELGGLERLFQQRHLLAHREGIVDDEYLRKSNDKSYSIGQRLVIREVAVR